MRIAAVPATECTFMPHVPLDLSTPRTSLTCISGIDHLHTQTVNRCQQQDSISEESSGVLLPTNQPVRVFQGNASTRAQCYEHCFSSFLGNDLSRRTHRVRPIKPMLLLHGASVALAFQNGPKIRPTIAVRSCDSGSCSYVTAQPAVRGVGFGYRKRDGHGRIPFVIFAEDLRTAFCSQIQLRPRQCKRAIQSTMRTSRNIELVLRALQQNPVIKPSGMLRNLQVSAVNQFCVQCGRSKNPLSFTCRLQCSAVVNPRSSIGAPYELTQALRRRTGQGSALFRLAHSDCAIGVGALEEGRQTRQAIRLVASGEQFQFVGQNYSLRLHTSNIAVCDNKSTPPQKRRRLSADQSAQNVPSDFAFRALCKTGLPSQANPFWKER